VRLLLLAGGRAVAIGSLGNEQLAMKELLAVLKAAVHVPLVFAFWPVPYALAFWAVYLWTRRGERQVLLRMDSAQQRRDKDAGSWQVIDYGSKAARVAALLVAFLTPPALEGTGRIALYAVGVATMVAGALLRRHCFRALGNNFTFQVTVSDKSSIVKHGAYRWVRHPSYTGGMLYNIGIGLALTNWLSVLLLAVGMATVYAYRVRIEEEALCRTHGDYSDYMRHTKRFIPFIF
jgi:protein-S-isoprenylcysteine O-methyltransferase Ste14